MLPNLGFSTALAVDITSGQISEKRAPIIINVSNVECLFARNRRPALLIAPAADTISGLNSKEAMEPNSPQALPSETTIDGLFETDFQFAIPPYQRAYSWGEKQLNQFLHDLKEQPDGKPYFLGHFLFERDGGVEAVSRQLFVIDGQQRLTTVIIFFSCLIREIERRAKLAPDTVDISLSSESLRARYLQRPDGNRLQTVPYDVPFFNRFIVDGLEENIHKAAPRSQKLIRAVRDIFESELESVSPAMLARWQNIIGTAVVTTFEVKKKVQATQIFTFQNDRGIKPTDLEILKAFLMHKVYLHSANLTEEGPIRDIEQHFSMIYNLTECINLSEDQVLGHHSTAFLQGSKPPLENVRAELKMVETNDAKVKWIKEFCHDLLESFRHTNEIERQAERDSAFADVLILDAPNSWPLLLKLFRFHKSEIGGATIQRVLRLMEITLFKLRYSTGDYRTHDFPSLAKDYDGKNADALKNRLEWCAQHGFKEYWTFNESFKAYLNGHHHYTTSTRYLLWKHENKLRERFKNPPILPAEYQNMYGKLTWSSTIDHVMPQHPSDGSAHPPVYQEHYLHNLGNLILMYFGKNASANNDTPVNKVKTLTDSPFSSHHDVAETICRMNQWKEEEIDARKEKIIRFALERWEAQ